MKMTKKKYGRLCYTRVDQKQLKGAQCAWTRLTGNRTLPGDGSVYKNSAFHAKI